MFDRWLPKKLAESARCSKANILDMCCGVGISPRALRKALPEAEVLAHLKIRFSREDRPVQHICGPVFSEENAEQTEFPGQSFQFVTLYCALHEVPKDSKEGRDRILRQAYRVLQPGGTLAIVDICMDYTPSDSMLAGEPYEKNIHRQLSSMKGFSKVQYETIVPKHVGMWTFYGSTLDGATIAILPTNLDSRLSSLQKHSAKQHQHSEEENEGVLLFTISTANIILYHQHLFHLLSISTITSSDTTPFL
ncbi:methyltransferase domain containing protein [Nitzschia inconspicua]|uniref:Methyltransferase domain containing protein n=1 Tax=Nitzschia inconspicua TaxID=303405 RepID=A0A9K3PUF0_9STRA|nr:methyltransferase domain containing protein [Nitzschia inconspicua]